MTEDFDWEEAEQSLYGFDTSRPSWPRSTNYWQGGKDHYPVDRKTGDRICEQHPGIVDIVRHLRHFRARALEHLVGDGGLGQVVEIGTDLSMNDDRNTHQVAQRADPTARVVHVDDDAMVLMHARALLTSNPSGECHCLSADPRDPETLVKGVAALLDLERPVAVVLINVLHLLPDVHADHLVTRLVQAVPADSHLVIAHPTAIIDAEPMEQIAGIWSQMGGRPITLRAPERIGRFLDGLALIEPGLVPCSRWRPQQTDPFDPPPRVDAFAAVGRVTSGRGR